MISSERNQFRMAGVPFPLLLCSFVSQQRGCGESGTPFPYSEHKKPGIRLDISIHDEDTQRGHPDNRNRRESDLPVHDRLGSVSADYRDRGVTPLS